MKRISPSRGRCPFCHKRLGAEHTTCQYCSTTLAVPSDSTGTSAESPDVEATKRVTANTADLYRSVVEEQQTVSADDDDATHLAAASPVSLYLSALATPADDSVDARAIGRVVRAADADATEHIPLAADVTGRVALHAPDTDATGRIVIRQAHADATELVAGHSIARLYARAVARETVSPAASSLNKQESTPPKATQSTSTAPQAKAAQRTPATPRKRTRRGFLAALHLVADLLLLLLLLFVSLAVYQQHVQAQQVLAMPQVQQQASQYKAEVARQWAAQQVAQVKQQAQTLVQQFHQEATNWGNTHLYHDAYDRHTYSLDRGYMQPGIGALIDKDLGEAHTTNDFALVIGETNYALFNLHMMEADDADHTPYNQVHASDLTMLAHYHLQQKTVIMVSLAEQAMRIYEQGGLVRAFYVTTGRFERPSLPGVWTSLDRQSPTLFVSGDPQGSPYWFPPTKINYAILYHLGGFFVHDAPWRGTFGPGTQFPHHDAYGNTAYNFDGSHGCINLSEPDASWVYHNTDFTTAIVMY